MGSKSSKNKETSLPVVDATEHGSDIIVESEDKYDKQVINYIKEEINNRPERFLLNNLLMCYVLFKNYEKELYDFSNTAVAKEEQDLNSKLKKEVKTCILPDQLLDKIQENIKICLETENENDKQSDRISHRTIFVVNDNIEVKDRTDVKFYTTIDVPGCQVEIEEYDIESETVMFSQRNAQAVEMREKAKERKGFLKLRVLKASSSEPNNPTNKITTTRSKTSTNSTPTTPEIQENGNQSSDEYSTIYAFKTPKNINIIRTSRRRDTLPDTCFESRKIKSLAQIENNEKSDSEREWESEDDLEDEETILKKKTEVEKEKQMKEEKLFENVDYLSSKGFMEYFQNEVFPNTTAKILGFEERAIEKAQAMSGCILCKKKLEEADVPYKIIPSVAIDWPSQATEYIYRKSRKTIIDKRDGIVYKWPTNDMVRELKTLNCVVIPKGFVKKKGENEETDIEWEIHFPKAERYLEMRMSHPQVRCYIFLLALYKTFIEQTTTYHGLLQEHIRTHMFWECEADAKNWPENKMGFKILQVIEDLNTGLSRSKIPHYFIREKNIFENIPSKYLQFAQRTFHNILQFPVMHFLKALKNLKFAQPNFYPIPDLDELHAILLGKNVKVTKRVKRKESKRKARKKSLVQVGSQRKVKKQQVDQLNWKKVNEKHNRKKYLIQKQKKKEEEAAKATQAVDEDEKLKFALADLNMITQTYILEFFIEHFMKIAKKSRIIGPKNQTLFYLKQAWYNLKVLEDITGTSADIQNTEIAINQERELLERGNTEDEEGIAPPTPQRNNEQMNTFIFQQNENQAPPKILKSTKTSFRNVQGEIAIRNKEKRLMRERRPKSVGFDEMVEKITFD